MTTRERFDNGVPVAAILIKCFLWTQPESLDAAGFYEWLNEPSPVQGRGIYQDLPVSNLAAFIYDDRPDVRLIYPDLTGHDRYEYLQWFLRKANWEYELDAAFINPVRAGLLRWANSHSTEQIAALGYSVEPCLPPPAGPTAPRSRHPMMTREHFDNGVPMAAILIKCFFWTQPLSQDAAEFYEWLNEPSPGQGRGIYQDLPVSNLVAFIYQERPDVRLTYPDLTGRHRYEYLQWFLRAAVPEYGLNAAFVNPVRAAMLRWANSPSPIDGTASAINFVLHICQTRTDVLGSFPDLQPLERRALARSVIRAAKALRLEDGYIAPLERSLGRRWLPRSITRWLDE
jgi:hypothetical protein